MKVFCPEHQKSFFAPRQSPIRCENRDHVLGKLDFDGEAGGPLDVQWQYCCNCEHFCPIDFDRDGLERCPVCTRRSSVLYVCDRCYTVSFESNTPLQTKNFSISAEGVPQPSCPGCLHPNTTDVREHACDQLAASFCTALSSCPFCGERLDIGPSFPSSVAAYLKKIKAAHKLNVTFDYESELFVPIEDGEFVLVTSNGDRSDSIVLPRSPRLANRRDFYEFYQDYYHCAKPNVGELHIIEPAAVEAVDNGWKLQRSGVLEVIEDPHKAQSSNNGQQSLTPASSFVATAAAPALDNQPQKKRQVAVAPLRLAPDKHKEANNSDSAVDVRMAPCSHCGSLIEGEYAYCWKCGNPLCKDVKPTVRTKESPPARLLVVEDELDDEELTVQHDETAPRSAPFLWALAERTQQSQPLISSVLKLVAVGLIGVLLSVVFFLLTRSNSSAASVSTTESAASSGQLQQKAVTTQTPVDEPPSQTAVARPEDELKKLRKTRLEASSSDTSAIMPIFVNAEKQYPDDYRFPYERAKFAIAAASDRHAHDIAFAALSLAAGKAIKTGKAPEMLDSLLRDSEGDFHKLAHGHPEWVQLQQMLKSKDSRALNVKMGL